LVQGLFLLPKLIFIRYLVYKTINFVALFYLKIDSCYMKYYLLLIGIFCASLHLISQSNIIYNRVEIPLAKVSLQTFSELGIETDHGSKISDNKFATDLSESEIAVLKKNHIPFNISIQDVSEYYRTRKSSDAPAKRDATICFPDEAFNPPANFNLGSMGGYFTYQEFLNILDDMKLKYPNLISSHQPISGFTTHDNNPVYWLRISDNPEFNENEPEVLYTALHHAREPQGLSQLIYFMWYVLEHYETDPEIKALLDNTELYFVPMINPDGYRYNELTNPNGGGLWRKNRRDNLDNTMGVDLNRNYGTFWGFDNSGSSPNTDSEVYRGDAPFSEPETQAMKQFCIDNDFKIALNYHSFGNLVIYPWGNDGSNCPDSTSFQLLADQMVDLNKFTAGTAIETVGYYVNGSSDDWMYGDQTQKPAILSFTPEVGEFYDGFWPFEDRIIPLSQACLEMNLQVLRSCHNNISLSYKEIPAMTGKDNKFSLQAIQTGVSPMQTTIQISEPTGKMIFPSPLKLVSMNSGSIENIAFDIVWGDVHNGDKLVVHYNWSDGLVNRLDSAEITFFDVKETLFADDCSTMDSWESTGTWGVTNSDSYSGGTCITDSPEGPYLVNDFSFISMKQSVSNASAYNKVYLKYHGKWQIERNFDHAAVILKDYTNNTDNYLCAFNMTKGTLEQAAENSVYESNSLKWEKEVIDITEFKDSEFGLLFELGSDGGDERDGFYLDDLEIIGYREKTTSTQAANNAGVLIYPNPTEGSIFFNSNEKITNCIISDLIGNQVYKTINSDQVGITSLELPSAIANGIYSIQFYNQGQIISQQKLIIIR